MACQISDVDSLNSIVNFETTFGCDQSAFYLPWGKVYIENIKEECDSPGEYFHDVAEKALYYTFNATERPTGNEEMYLLRTKVLLNISGTQAARKRAVIFFGWGVFS